MYWFWHSYLINWAEGRLISITSWLWRKKALELRKKQNKQRQNQ